MTASELPVRYPRLVLVVAAVLSLFAGVGVTRLEIDPSIRTMLIEDDPEHEAHARYTRAFGSDEILSVAIRVGDALNPESIRLQRSVVEAIESVDGVLAVDSLATESEVYSDRGELVARTVQSLMGTIAHDQELTEQFRERISAHSIWSGWLVSSDLSTVALQIELDDSEVAQLARSSTLSAVERILAENFESDSYFFAGHPFMKMEIARTISRDLVTLMPISIALMTLFLLLATRSLAIGISAVACVLISGLWMLGAMGWVGLGLTALTNAAPTILLALATAYFLHLTAAYQRRSNLPNSRAVLESIQEVFAPTWVAATTTAIGYGSLSLSSVPIVREFGWSLAIGAMMAGSVGTFVLPSILVLSRPAYAGGLFRDGSWLTEMLTKISFSVARAPRAVVALSLAVGAALFVSALNVEIDSSAPNRFAEDSRFRRSADFYRAMLSGDVVETVYLTGSPGTFFEPEVLGRIDQFERASRRLKAIDKTISISDIVSRVNWVVDGEPSHTASIPSSVAAVAQLVLLYESSVGPGALADFVSSDQSQAKILLKADVRSSAESAMLKNDLRQLVDRFVSTESGPYSVISTEMLLSKSADAIVVEQLASAVIAVGLILVLVGSYFRSASVALLMVVPNVLPLVICLGVMSILGVQLSDATSIIGATAIGIAVDSTVHVISIARRYGGENLGSKFGVLSAFVLAGRPVAVSSMVVVVGFSTLLLSEFRSVAELGLLTAFTMLCCLVGDLVVLPAEMLIFSRKEDQEALLIRAAAGTAVGKGRIDGSTVYLEQVAGGGGIPIGIRRVQLWPSGRAIEVSRVEAVMGFDFGQCGDGDGAL